VKHKDEEGLVEEEVDCHSIHVMKEEKEILYILFEMLCQ
jgi:hypothetical protein